MNESTATPPPDACRADAAQGAADAHIAPGTVVATCANCDAPLPEPRPRFCGACGQETETRAPRIGEFMQQFAGSYFASEGALWRTLRLLLLRPGELTAQYLAGRRKHYVLPLRLFLSLSLVVFIAMRVASFLDFQRVQALDAQQALPERPRAVQLELGFGRAGLHEGVFFCEGLPAWMCARLQPRFEVDTRTLMREMQLLTDRVAGNAGAMLVLLVPVFALGLRLLYWRGRLHTTEHLVFALHVHAAWLVALGVMLLEWWPLVLLALLSMPLYLVLAMRRVFGGPWWGVLLRAAVLLPVHAVLVGGSALSLSLVVFLLL